MDNHECKTYKQECAIAQTVTRLYNSRYLSVKACYNKPSTVKQQIELYIQNEMDSKNGFNYRVISYNVFFFTCGYFYEYIDIETGEILVKMVIHTPSRKEEYDVTRFLEFKDKVVYGIKIGCEYQPNQYCKDLTQQ